MKKISFFIIFALFISLSLITNISALENNFNACPMSAIYGFNGSYGAGMAILSWVISILLIILIISGIYWFIKSASNQNNKGKK